MGEELRYALIVAGVLAIIGLALHGWWADRKDSQQADHKFFNDDASNEKAEGFDEYGVGKKRKLAPGEKPQPRPQPTVAPRSAKVKVPAKQILEERERPAARRDEPTLSFSAGNDQDDAQNTEASAGAADAPSEVLILYVLVPENQEIDGNMLLPSLLTLGFKYGEMNIFHRHQDAAGSGGVLFSLANMFNPGTFDIEDMDKLQTRGLSLFMTLPGPGEALQNFNLMHNAAKKLADEFGGQVLDASRSVLTVQTTRHYVEKIREFQRQLHLRG